MDKVLQSMRPKHIQKIAGSGNKFVALLDETVDFYANFVPGLKFWDMCACEALMQGRMGVVSNA